MTTSPPPTVQWESPDPVAGPAPGVEFAPHGGRLVAYIIDTIIVTVVFIVGVPGRSRHSSPTARRPTESGRSPLWAPRPRSASSSCSSASSSRCCTSRSSGRGAARRPGCGRSACGSSGIGMAARSAGGPRCSGWSGCGSRAAVFYIGFIWIFVDKRRRGWQDLIAGTVVVKKP